MCSMSKCADLSYALDNIIRFWLWILSVFCGNIKFDMDIICILWICPYPVDILRIFCKYPCSVDIRRILWKYLRSVNILQISWIYLHFVDITHIAPITSYLAHNFCHGIQSFVLVVDIIYIVHTRSYLACNVRPISQIYSSIESDWCITSFPVFNLI